MSIANVMTTDLPTVSPNESLREAAGKMKERGFKALPVCEDERLVGIITDWDITTAVADASVPSEQRVTGYMSTDLVVAAPNASFAEATELMAERRLHHLLIADQGKFLGLVHLDVEWSEVGGRGEPMATFTAPI
jgi:CBS domain-containing protein